MKKIVIPTELTLHSLHLVRHALTLLKGETCEITLLHVTPVPTSITELLLLPRETEKAGEPSADFTQALERLRKSYALEISRLRVAHLCCDSALTLKNFLRKHQIDLVISPVALTPPSEVMQHFNQLAADLPFPVLYIPEFFEPTRFRKIAFVLDAQARRTTLPDQALVDLLCRQDYYVTFLLVFAPGTSTATLKQALDELYAAPVLQGVEFAVHLQQRRDLTSGVVAFIEEFAMDLVVTCQRRSLLDYLRVGRRVRAKALHTKVPCLSVA
jgi:nucleotide-binding universal stress UspA family protein